MPELSMTVASSMLSCDPSSEPRRNTILPEEDLGRVMVPVAQHMAAAWAWQAPADTRVRAGADALEAMAVGSGTQGFAGEPVETLAPVIRMANDVVRLATAIMPPEYWTSLKFTDGTTVVKVGCRPAGMGSPVP